MYSSEFKVTEKRVDMTKTKALSLFNRKLKTLYKISQQDVSFIDFYACFLIFAPRFINISEHSMHTFRSDSSIRRYRKFSGALKEEASTRALRNSYLARRKAAAKKIDGPPGKQTKNYVEAPTPALVKQGIYSLYEFLLFVVTIQQTRAITSNGELGSDFDAKVLEKTSTAYLRIESGKTLPKATTVLTLKYEPFVDISGEAYKVNELLSSGFTSVFVKFVDYYKGNTVRIIKFSPTSERQKKNGLRLHFTRKRLYDRSVSLPEDEDAGYMKTNLASDFVWLNDRCCYVAKQNAAIHHHTVLAVSGMPSDLVAFLIRTRVIYVDVSGQGGKDLKLCADTMSKNRENYTNTYKLVFDKNSKYWYSNPRKVDIYSVKPNTDDVRFSHSVYWFEAYKAAFECSHCGRWFTFSSRHPRTDSFCHSCAENEGLEPANSAIRVLSYETDVLLHHPIKEPATKKKMFGLEVEASFNPRSIEMESIKFRDFLERVTKTHWIGKRDGSIRGGASGTGVEFVSTPATLETQREELVALYDDSYFSQNFNPSHVSCGFHVHVDRKSLTEWQIHQIRRFIAADVNQLYLNDVAGRGENSFCVRKMSNVIKEVLQDPVSGDWKKMCGSTTRYSALNLSRESTIEFRLFAGSNKPDLMISRLEFCDAICEYFTPGNASTKIEDRLNFKSFNAFVREHKTKWPYLFDELVRLNYIAKTRQHISGALTLYPKQEKTTTTTTTTTETRVASI